MRRPSFTLIELLCVIAVIAVLASLLAPGIMQAMRRSKMTVCISNFRQMGIGAGVFGTDNNGDMPWAAPNHPTLGPGALSGYGTEAIWGTSYGWSGHGLLWEKGYITSPKVFFCPTAGSFTYDSAWGWDARPGWIASSYSWNGMADYISGSSWGRRLHASKDPGRTPMAADMFCPNSNITNTIANHPDGFVVLRLDGSAQLVKSDPLALISRSTNQISYHAMATYGWQGAFK